MDARTSRYHEVYARSLRDPQGFWGEAAQAIDWIEQPKRVFDPSAGVYGRWFVEHMYMIAPAGAYVGNWLQSFKEFPPRQKPGSFNLSDAMEKLSESGG